MSGEYYGVRRQGMSEEEYLAHLGNFKYLDRFWKNGKWNYVYNNVKKAVNGAVRGASNAIGLTARNKMNQAQRWYNMKRNTKGASGLRNASNRLKTAKSAYGKTLLGRAESLGKRISDSVSSGVSNAVSSVDKAIGISARNKAAQAKKMRNITAAAAKAGKGRKNGQSKRATAVYQQRYRDAQESYNKSLLGRAERFGRGVSKSVNRAVSGLPGAANRAMSDAQKAIGIGGKKKVDQAKKMRDITAGAAKAGKGRKNGQSKRAAGVYQQRYRDAVNEYDRSALGRLDKAGRSVVRGIEDVTGITKKKKKNNKINRINRSLRNQSRNYV